ncbi:hypothetical protein HDU99_002609, partial [Rhizoclosmatium hyalinum]
MSFPTEIKERIFILASNGRLAYANKEFNIISSSNLVRALWLIEKYGPDNALAR